MTQSIAQHDLIIVSDSGQFYVVKMKESADGFHEPQHVERLDPVFQKVPDYLRSVGVEVADLPDHAVDAGCSCYLLNLQRLSGRDPTAALGTPEPAAKKTAKKASAPKRSARKKPAKHS